MEYRKEIKKLNTLIIKVGSNVITKDKSLNKEAINKITQDIAKLKKENTQVILVSSGAISAGRSLFKTDSNEVKVQQALSSIGQPILMNEYQKQFSKHGLNCAQLLLTAEDFKDKKRFINLKDSILTLLENNIIPILNENDAISFQEITVGDNDHLAATAAAMLEVDLLLLITSSNGLYTMDPEHPDAKHIPIVDYNKPRRQVNTTSKTKLGRGGMQSKLLAVEKVSSVGIPTIISSKDEEAIILNPLTKEIGTFFIPDYNNNLGNRRSWIQTTLKNNIGVEIDEGAKNALKKNASLLPKGIIAVKGSFSRGDSIEVTYEGKVIAIGLSEYNSTQINKIKQKHSDEILDILNYKISNVAIHKDNLILKA